MSNAVVACFVPELRICIGIEQHFDQRYVSLPRFDRLLLLILAIEHDRIQFGAADRERPERCRLPRPVSSPTPRVL